MRQVIFTVVAAAVAIVATSPARAAGYYTGSELHASCIAQSPEAAAPQKRAMCRGYIGGAIDALTLDHFLRGQQACIPNEVTLGQIIDVVTNYLRDNPASRHNGAALIARVAIVEAFPSCKTSK